jgi:hypothetical protein
LGKSRGPHPLISHGLLTDGVDLFVRDLGELVNLSMPNQQTMAEIISAYLKRIEWEDNEPAVLFPFSSADMLDGRKSVMIDPRNLVRSARDNRHRHRNRDCRRTLPSG